MKLFYAFLTFSVFLACQSDSRDNPRAYVQGKITGTNLKFDKISVILESDHTNIAETVPANSGDFTLSGPLISEDFSVVLNKKIESFTASKQGCTLSADSLQILVPAGNTYVTFDEIKVKE